jgi:hypothetical protein
VIRQKTLTLPGDLDQLPALDRLTEVALAVFAEHPNAAERCAVCRTSWPCEQVVLADHNLAVL